ncbi:MAG: hypothetical protein GY780_16590 [bacterium]|nr:hypothetical protein [bacterium]
MSKKLDRVEAELSRLMNGADKKPSSGGRKKVAGKKATRKKVARKKAAKKSVTKKKTTKKKAAIKKATRKKAGRPKLSLKKTVKKTTTKKTGKIKLEDVVVKVITSNGGPMNYKDLLGVILKKKLFVSKSANFDNVLRRTLSTSKLVKRAGRGIYAVA